MLNGYEISSVGTQSDMHVGSRGDLKIVLTPSGECSVMPRFLGCGLWPVHILEGERAEGHVIESLIGCTDDARFSVCTLQFKLACLSHTNTI